MRRKSPRKGARPAAAGPGGARRKSLPALGWRRRGPAPSRSARGVMAPARRAAAGGAARGGAGRCGAGGCGARAGRAQPAERTRAEGGERGSLPGRRLPPRRPVLLVAAGSRPGRCAARRGAAPGSCLLRGNRKLQPPAAGGWLQGGLKPCLATSALVPSLTPA